MPLGMIKVIIMVKSKKTAIIEKLKEMKLDKCPYCKSELKFFQVYNTNHVRGECNNCPVDSIEIFVPEIKGFEDVDISGGWDEPKGFPYIPRKSKCPKCKTIIRFFELQGATYSVRCQACGHNTKLEDLVLL